jgi:hypothetical protein
VTPTTGSKNTSIFSLLGEILSSPIHLIVGENLIGRKQLKSEFKEKYISRDLILMVVHPEGKVEIRVVGKNKIKFFFDFFFFFFFYKNPIKTK